jgi:hypothetical protein
VLAPRDGNGRELFLGRGAVDESILLHVH